jgi:hypothetical protein
MNLLVCPKCWNLENINVIKTPACVWGLKETEYLSVIVDNGNFRLALDTFAVTPDWPLPKTQKHINCSYGNCIHHHSDCAAVLTELCHKSVLGNVVHTKVTTAAVELFKARMISALVFPILELENKAEWVVATDANEIAVVGVLL